MSVAEQILRKHYKPFFGISELSLKEITDAMEEYKFIPIVKSEILPLKKRELKLTADDYIKKIDSLIKKGHNINEIHSNPFNIDDPFVAFQIEHIIIERKNTSLISEEDSNIVFEYVLKKHEEIQENYSYRSTLGYYNYIKQL